MIVAPMGASAVLVFAIPASPLAQPWPVIGGNAISALVGVMVAKLVGEPLLAAALAVSLAIAAMSFTRSLHPPGGAAALTAVIGGQSVASLGFLFPFAPVALNAAVLVAMGIGFHNLARRQYPHFAAPAPVNTHLTADVPSQLRVGFREADVDAALSTLGETFDIDRGDLDRLLREVAFQAGIRSRGPLLCSDVMSRDVVSVSKDAQTTEARALLLRHNIRTLPVVDEAGRLAGIVGLRDLALADLSIERSIAPAAEAFPQDEALALLPVLTDGRTHAVVIVDAGRKVLGLVTQTDLLAAVAGMPAITDASVGAVPPRMAMNG
ncbi:HPP family protein [Mesorhizobium sp. BAC0120]|uniref:HPP family protein n=1 Tax=Mesorhizobium sp. BAC0120 TaxID=3090670 RepID=UPI00298D1DE6|nr:HPP family protein [Mesorhizobium sp. BAC0120]